ncbi:MAG: hypothetical protein LBD23_04330 [Oscillospiraceae bacterium]|jgi:hypothetical protein|nr:hypothetical protein [Oscillospiraceae bacterium]
MFEPTSKSAIDYARKNQLEEWVHEYLCTDGNGKYLSDILKRKKIQYKEPKRISLDFIRRCAGPEPEMEFTTEEPVESFWKLVDEQAARFNTGDWDMPPFLALDRIIDGTYGLEDGNHRYEALKKLGINEYWVILFKPLQIESE